MEQNTHDLPQALALLCLPLVRHSQWIILSSPVVVVAARTEMVVTMLVVLEVVLAVFAPLLGFQ